ncbi:MAG: HlyD family type I secretion periplasmic adaptor subunit [Rhodospirillales bacterium]
MTIDLLLRDDRAATTPGLLPPVRVGRNVAAGLLTVALAVGGIGGWATFAPIHGAANAPGVLVPASGRKTVRHPEGGLVVDVGVRDGDRVSTGQILLRLDDVAATARVDALNADIAAKLATEARLVAERDGAAAPSWPIELLSDAATPAVRRILADQSDLFASRAGQLLADERLYAERAQSLDREAEHLADQQAHGVRELAVVRQEIAVTRQLLDRGNAPRSRLFEQQKEEARLLARDAELAAKRTQLRQQAIETRAELRRRKDERRERILADLQALRADLARQVEDRRDALNRLRTREIVAPEAGTVVGLGARIAGSALGAGEAVADIVPAGDALLAEVRVEPRDIRDVHVGLPARLSVGALNTRVVGTLPGTVVHVSADRVEDPQTRRMAYLVRVRPDEPTALPQGTVLVPGMPVDAQILLSARTPLDYLMAPIVQAYHRAFSQE